MKKKLLMALSYVLVVALAITGTVAYLTDTEGATNVMTLGTVKITQNEQQRVEANGEFTSELEEFKQGKRLMPITYDTLKTADEVTIGDYTLTLSDDENNYVDKIISVTNTGKSDAYIRTLVAVPTGGSDWEPTPVSANNCWLHWNIPNDYAKYWNLNTTPVLIEIDEIGYYVWEFTHKAIVESKKTTFPMVRGFYMDQKVDHDDNGYYMTYTDGTTKRIDDMNLNGQVNVFALSQAVQADGFSDAATALTAGFGAVTAENTATVQSWFTGMEIPTVISDADELVVALENGEDVLLTESIEIDPAEMSNAYGKTGINVKNGQTIDGNGNTLDIAGAGGTWDSGINTTGGTIKNLTVTGSFRGIFINHNSTHSEPVVLDNVIINGTTYTVSCDQGLYQTLQATNSTFNGWTSFAKTLGSASFENCNFGESNGYKYARPYCDTTFTNCNFVEGFNIDARQSGEVTLVNCYVGNTLVTAENITTLLGDIAATAIVK